jgi:D-glycero-D-manno-heptose 1,7-bisphosphate phosphatase
MKNSLRRAVFLDRDGVINEAVIREGKPYPPASLAELRVTPDAKSGLSRLFTKGYLLIGITNQPDVARGTQKQEVVEAINEYLVKSLPIEEIYVCYHDDKDDCKCRKPRPGLILEAAKKWDIELQNSFMIGDRWKDVEAGKRAGCKTVWINRLYNETSHNTVADNYSNSINQAVDWILSLEEK